MNYFLQGFGVFLGVVAGVAITLITQWINEKLKESQKVKNLKFEIELKRRRGTLPVFLMNENFSDCLFKIKNTRSGR